MRVRSAKIVITIGLPNFFDIFRTLNGLLVTFNKRKIKGVPRVGRGIGSRCSFALRLGQHRAACRRQVCGREPLLMSRSFR